MMLNSAYVSSILGDKAEIYDRTYETVSAAHFKLIDQEYRRLLKHTPQGSSWWKKLFVKDGSVWSKKNDCDNHAFTYLFAAHRIHYWSKSKAEGIAAGLVLTPTHAQIVLIIDKGGVPFKQFLNYGKKVVEPGDLRKIHLF